MIVKVLTEHHLEFLSLKGGSIGSSESTLVKIPHCWKSHVMHRKEWQKVQQVHYTMGGSRGGGGDRGSWGPDPPPPEKSQKYRVSLQYWSPSPKIHKATKQAFNVGPSSAPQRNAISMAFRWWADDDPFIAVL